MGPRDVPPLAPTLRTERLILRHPKQTDAAAYAAFFTDADASVFYGGPLSLKASWARLAQDVGHWGLKGYGVWVLEAKETGATVGTCGFAWPDGWPRRELTWWIGSAFRRRGYALEASRAAIAYAYDVWQWDQVETHFKDANIAARGLVDRLGGKHTDRLAFPDGHTRDVFEVPRPVKGVSVR